MTDEEKKTIEYLKRHILPYYGSKGRIEFILNDIILNLIEKQQKEIEELKEEDTANLAYYDQIYQSGIYTGQRAVEDKIKAKIEELEKEQEDNRKSLYNAVNNLNFKEIDKISNRICVNMTVSDILQSLLEKK